VLEIKRKVGQRIIVPPDLIIELVDNGPVGAIIGFICPRDVDVVREELMPLAEVREVYEEATGIRREE